MVDQRARHWMIDAYCISADLTVFSSFFLSVSNWVRCALLSRSFSSLLFNSCNSCRLRIALFVAVAFALAALCWCVACRTKARPFLEQKSQRINRIIRLCPSNCCSLHQSPVFESYCCYLLFETGLAYALYQWHRDAPSHLARRTVLERQVSKRLLYRRYMC